MNIESVSTEKLTDKSQQNISSHNDSENQTSFSEEYKLLLAQNGLNLGINDQALLASIINNAKADTNNFLGYANSLNSIRSAFNYDTLTISKDDALFFNELVEKTDYIVNEKNDGTAFQTNLLKIANTSETQSLKSTEVSKALMNLIEEAYKTQKPTRIDFDNNVSVILRIGRDGKVSAEFLPGDKAVEQYLRNNIGYLKERFEEQNLEYGDIIYKPFKDNSKRQRNNNQNGGQQ